MTPPQVPNGPMAYSKKLKAMVVLPVEISPSIVPSDQAVFDKSLGMHVEPAVAPGAPRQGVLTVDEWMKKMAFPASARYEDNGPSLRGVTLRTKNAPTGRVLFPSEFTDPKDVGKDPHCIQFLEVDDLKVEVAVFDDGRTPLVLADSQLWTRFMTQGRDEGTKRSVGSRARQTARNHRIITGIAIAVIGMGACGTIAGNLAKKTPNHFTTPPIPSALGGGQAVPIATTTTTPPTTIATPDDSASYHQAQEFIATVQKTAFWLHSGTGAYVENLNQDGTQINSDGSYNVYLVTNGDPVALQTLANGIAETQGFDQFSGTDSSNLKIVPTNVTKADLAKREKAVQDALLHGKIAPGVNAKVAKTMRDSVPADGIQAITSDFLDPSKNPGTTVLVLGPNVTNEQASELNKNAKDLLDPKVFPGAGNIAAGFFPAPSGPGSIQYALKMGGNQQLSVDARETVVTISR